MSGGPSRPKYAKVSRRLWNDATFRSLSAPQPNAQTLWLYLLTCPEQGAFPGAFRAFEAGIAAALGWSMEDFRKAWGEVSGKGLAKASWRAGFVWLPKALKHNPPESPNHVLGWRSSWEDLPECQLKNEAYLLIKSQVEPLGEAYRKALGKGLPQPSPSEQEQEQEHSLRDFVAPRGDDETKPRRPRPEPSSDHGRVMTHYSETFERLVGRKPKIDGGDGKWATDALRLVGLEGAKSLISEWLGDTWKLEHMPSLKQINLNTPFSKPMQTRLPVAEPKPVTALAPPEEQQAFEDLVAGLVAKIQQP